MTPTVESVRATCVTAHQFIESHHLYLNATIDDDPIGRRERGKCHLQVERARGKGWLKGEGVLFCNPECATSFAVAAYRDGMRMKRRSSEAI